MLYIKLCRAIKFIVMYLLAFNQPLSFFAIAINISNMKNAAHIALIIIINYFNNLYYYDWYTKIIFKKESDNILPK